MQYLVVPKDALKEMTIRNLIVLSHFTHSQKRHVFLHIKYVSTHLSERPSTKALLTAAMALEASSFRQYVT